MIKQLIIYNVVFIALYILGYNIHQFILLKQELYLSFSLEKVYLFHTAFSALICINFLLLSTVNKIFEQLGFIYLASIVLKLLLFGIIFYKPIFSEENLSLASRISLFIPMILFLLTEAIFVAKILKKRE
ncbi:hypothetical protein BW723_05375 [Polaribacter reichenbachii]|uniref:Uncharacterized protein n=1 Tax=Polaribacter reichenbachii TaxID=996801 RepID=A0A1B8TUK6_9FLAO|nr:DUF6168 family protein [Polaribacter reichenbachii]APZ45760.1 hypothetical protein BW723_05375 [Polaribacter reichenbachii]AUC19622.1 hypothetical protein BTO17_13390 [Polaribacter reichenbachii]OBY63224.1 hypothetical protein LPB301_10335 [Polaribacter reichenbachii]